MIAVAIYTVNTGPSSPMLARLSSQIFTETFLLRDIL